MNLSDVDLSLVGELSELENHLLHSHELIVVRGKVSTQLDLRFVCCGNSSACVSTVTSSLQKYVVVPISLLP